MRVVVPLLLALTLAGPGSADTLVAARAGSLGLDPLMVLPDGRTLDGLALTQGFGGLLAEDGELLVHDADAGSFERLAELTSAHPILLPGETPLYGESVYDPVAEEFVDYDTFVDREAVVPPTVATVLARTSTVVLLETGLARSTRPPDNCPPISNPSQTDSGGLDTTSPDGIGDPCQCGDADNNGIVGNPDVSAIRDFLAGLPPGLSQPGLDKCPVGGVPAECNILTVALLARALAPAPGPGIAQVCPAATAP